MGVATLMTTISDSVAVPSSLLLVLSQNYDPRGYDSTWSQLAKGELEIRLTGLEQLLGHDAILT